MKSTHPRTLVRDIHDESTAKVYEPDQPSFPENWKITGGMFAEKVSNSSILIVDDDPDVRKLIRIILENSGYDILEACDGQQAIQLLTFRENSFLVDLIITDLSMPRVDGGSAITFFLNEFPHIPIIILTGNSDAELAIGYMRIGISDFLVKPVGLRQLLASVSQAIDQRRFSWA